jgi:hypothetical protein
MLIFIATGCHLFEIVQKILIVPLKFFIDNGLRQAYPGVVSPRVSAMELASSKTE